MAGNENVYQLLKSFGTTDCELRMEAYAFDGDSYWLNCSKFEISSEADKYRVEWYEMNSMNDSGGLCADWDFHKDKIFQTPDNAPSDYCTKVYKNGWWFGDCLYFYLNGPYYAPPRKSFNGIYIQRFKGQLTLKGSRMMIRPSDPARPCNNPCMNGGT